MKATILLLMECEVTSAETAREELTAKLDRLRETTLPSETFGVTLMVATPDDLERFAEAGLLLPNTGVLTDDGTPEPEVLLAKAVAELPTETNLIYIDRNDEFGTEQIDLILYGEIDKVVEQVDENYSEHVEHSIDNLLEECLNDEQERDILRDSDQWNDFREACLDIDSSTPMADLARNTGRVMVRFHFLDNPDNDHHFGDGNFNLPPDSWRWDGERTEQEAKRLCGAAGLDWDINREAMIELVENATGGGALCVLAYVDFDDLFEAAEHVARDPEHNKFTVTFDGKFHLLVHDRYNGSGHDVTVQGKITFQIDHQAMEKGVLRLDRRGVNGYSWSDDIAGVHKPAYEFDPIIKLHPEPAANSTAA